MSTPPRVAWRLGRHVSFTAIACADIPAGTPRATVQRLHAAAVKGLSKPETAEKIAVQGMDAAPSASPEGTRLVDAPRALYHGTAFADGTALLAPPWREAGVCDLWCTEEALFVQLEGGRVGGLEGP